MPRIEFSLLVPSYNRPQYIRETVLSLLENSAPDVEIIVSDDASPKRAEIWNALADLIAAGKLKYLQQEKNLGWSNNRNALVDAAQGENVILLGDDDRLKRGAIDRIRAWRQKCPHADLYGFGYDVIDAEGAYVYSRRSPRWMCYEIGKPGWEELFYFNALPMWSHHPFTMCCRRSLALELRYNPQAGIADDTLFLFETLQRGGKLLVIPESLFCWRVVSSPINGYINLSSERPRTIESKRLIWLNLLRNPQTRPEVRKLISTRCYLGRVLQVNNQTVRAIESKLPQFASGEMDISSPLLEAKLIRPENWAMKCNKLLRVARILGPGHLGNVMRFYIDKLKYRRGCFSGKRSNTYSS